MAVYESGFVYREQITCSTVCFLSQHSQRMLSDNSFMEI